MTSLRLKGSIGTKMKNFRYTIHENIFNQKEKLGKELYQVVGCLRLLIKNVIRIDYTNPKSIEQ